MNVNHAQEKLREFSFHSNSVGCVSFVSFTRLSSHNWKTTLLSWSSSMKMKMQRIHSVRALVLFSHRVITEKGFHRPSVDVFFILHGSQPIVPHSTEVMLKNAKTCMERRTFSSSVHFTFHQVLFSTGTWPYVAARRDVL